jgi:hypothetical protein
MRQDLTEMHHVSKVALHDVAVPIIIMQLILLGGIL